MLRFPSIRHAVLIGIPVGGAHHDDNHWVTTDLVGMIDDAKVVGAVGGAVGGAVLDKRKAKKEAEKDSTEQK